jgi:hypothetical protein
VHSRLLAASLDRRIAAGESPGASDVLAFRAAHLVTMKNRRRVADCLEALRDDRLRAGPVSSAVPLDSHALRVAWPAVEQLVGALRARATVSPRGMALARMMLTEPCSPLYRPVHGDALYEAAREALFALGADTTVAG